MPSPVLRLGCKNPNPTIPDESLTAKVVALAAAPAPCGDVLYRTANRSRTHGKAVSPSVDTSMKTFHEWLRERQQQEGLWLGDDKLAQPGMSNVNPLDQPKAKEKPKPTVSPVKTLKAKPAAKALKRPRVSLSNLSK
ncbi:hypothetical protein KOR42_54180 [Thalassoglobus neptunius]|uniref:Uncharacterized protein n=1 Tax=Thalassoglobus neptunius TaxID=1938619 RepID=A0A5C5UYH4_9PLAN|nr:hypothetical protein [Thalassoglobus neptunius]TWT30557.1 hypothetical protein KOR42_54180 [Thalassoglobus neptunius]